MSRFCAAAVPWLVAIDAVIALDTGIKTVTLDIVRVSVTFLENPRGVVLVFASRTTLTTFDREFDRDTRASDPTTTTPTTTFRLPIPSLVTSPLVTRESPVNLVQEAV